MVYNHFEVIILNRSICQVIPDKNNSIELQTVNFVYETEFKKLKQPFNRNIYYIHIVTRGSGILKVNSKEYNLTVSSAFLFFPSVQYEIEATPDFEYIYIGYTGTSADDITKKFTNNIKQYVYYNFDNVLDFWKESIRRITPENANILTECALFYALSFTQTPPSVLSENPFDIIVMYIEKNFTSPDLSVKKVAGIFSYTEKYLSKLFKKNMGITFSRYINSLRISHSIKLMESGEKNISDIATKSGYIDPLYFSKVFKKEIGLSPSKKIQEIQEKKYQ